MPADPRVAIVPLENPRRSVPKMGAAAARKHLFDVAG